MYVFLDEVQLVNEWNIACRSLRLENTSLFISGSNSRLLSKEFTKELSGRYVSFCIRPFVYKEIAEYAHELKKQYSISDYLTYGGFPKAIEQPDKTSIVQYLNDLNQTIVINDIQNRYRIRKTELFKRLVNYVLISNARIFSASSIQHYLSSERLNCSINTVMKYLSYLEEAYVVRRVPQYSTRAKRELTFYVKLYEIVEKAREEHRSAIEWLNEHIDSSISFFLIELHAVRIGDSLPAPRFDVIEEPNDFNIQVKTQNKSNKENEREGNRFEFWTQFNDVLEKRGLPFNKRKASTDHWYDFAIGSAACHLCMELINKSGFIRINMWIPNSMEQYNAFYAHKDEIESKISQKLLWEELDGKKASRVSTKIEGLSFKDQSNYDYLMNKSIDLLIEFKNAFKPFLI